MRRVLGLEALGEPLARSAVTIGKFFAVHRGHQALLQATVAEARRHQAPAVVLTFDRHPLEVLRPGTRLPLLAGLEERLDLIEAQGVDVTLVARVTPEFLGQEPEQFVRAVLVDQLGAREVLAGGQFRFGKGARGDMALLQRMGEECGFRAVTVPPVIEGGERISSSRVAACVQAGNVAEAGTLLGRAYCVPGEVIPGEQLGRQLGYPTANVRTPADRLLPADGVYVGRVAGEGEVHPAAINLGVRPALGGRPRLLEAYVLDWSGDLYGQQVRIEFLQRLRDEQRFPSLDALRARIERDVQETREFFGARGAITAPPA